MLGWGRAGWSGCLGSLDSSTAPPCPASRGRGSAFATAPNVVVFFLSSSFPPCFVLHITLTSRFSVVLIFVALLFYFLFTMFFSYLNFLSNLPVTALPAWPSTLSYTKLPFLISSAKDSPPHRQGNLSQFSS